MDISIRQISTADAPAVARLSSQLGYPLSAEQILQNIKFVVLGENHDAFVAIHEEQVVGWMGLARTIMIESLPYCEINGLVIDETYRGKGIGKLLVNRAKQWAIEKKVGTIRLRCNVKRVEAHRFYQHLGFKQIKQQTTFEIDSAN